MMALLRGLGVSRDRTPLGAGVSRPKISTVYIVEKADRGEGAIFGGVCYVHPMRFEFPVSTVPDGVASLDWTNWLWQMRHSLSTESDFAKVFELTEAEKQGLNEGRKLFEVRTTPYYAALAATPDAILRGEHDPIRRILMPRSEELHRGAQAMLDPLGERKNNPAPRIVHRYPDRALFLVTDFCSVYCRYCTRKHFTGGEESFIRGQDYEKALSYIRRATGLREIILSGGDPLTLSDERLERVLFDIRKIEHIEIIRVGTRMPVVCPMRVTEDLVKILRQAKPVFLMTHFNHPRELTAEAAHAIETFVDHGVPVFNQMVLLNGVNNDVRIVQALSRRLLFLRAKPYYMFQCDPSIGTDHLRTSVEESLEISRELWGRISGLAMPNLSLDIPNGGGKASLVPNFELNEFRTGTREEGVSRVFEGWDGIRATYKSPPVSQYMRPLDAEFYEREWLELTSAKAHVSSQMNSYGPTRLSKGAVPAALSNSK